MIFCENIFMKPSLTNRLSQGTEILRECSPPNMCHVSHVIYHVSLVMCHLFFEGGKVAELFRGGSVINVAYPV